MSGGCKYRTISVKRNRKNEANVVVSVLHVSRCSRLLRDYYFTFYSGEERFNAQNTLLVTASTHLHTHTHTHTHMRWSAWLVAVINDVNEIVDNFAAIMSARRDKPRQHRHVRVKNSEACTSARDAFETDGRHSAPVMAAFCVAGSSVAAISSVRTVGLRRVSD